MPALKNEMGGSISGNNRELTKQLYQESRDHGA